MVLPMRVSAQQGAAMTVSQPSGTMLLNDYAFAGKQSRSLQAGGWTLNQRLTPRLFAWYGQQSIVATGRYRDDRFAADTDRFGARLLLSRNEARGWLVGYDGYRPRNAHFIGPNSSGAAPGEVTRVQYPSTRTDMLTLRYTFGKSLPEAPSLRNMPTYNIRAGILHVQAVGSQANGFSLGGGMVFPIRSNLTGDVEVTGFTERATGDSASVAFKSHLAASLVYRPFRWVRLVAGAEVMPSGLPYGGTSLSGFSGYLLYQPGGAIQGLHNGLIADFNLQLQIAGHF
jgi:hypothetical protein